MFTFITAPEMAIDDSIETYNQNKKQTARCHQRSVLSKKLSVFGIDKKQIKCKDYNGKEAENTTSKVHSKFCAFETAI